MARSLLMTLLIIHYTECVKKYSWRDAMLASYMLLFGVCVCVCVCPSAGLSVCHKSVFSHDG